MKTPQEWWDSVKGDPEKIIAWLKNQYHGEATAATRIRELITVHFEPDSTPYKLSSRIASDEDRHAAWIGALLITRGITPKILKKEERYWSAALEDAPEGDGLYVAGIAAHAEEMRLARIKIIMDDDTAPKDIQLIFKEIYHDEVFHAKAFKEISGDNYYDQTTEKHAAGLEALGLIL